MIQYDIIRYNNKGDEFMENMRVKLNATISPKQMEFLTNRSNEMGINKSALVSICIQSYMDNEKLKESMSGVGSMMQEMQEMMKTMQLGDSNNGK